MPSLSDTEGLLLVACVEVSQETDDLSPEEYEYRLAVWNPDDDSYQELATVPKPSSQTISVGGAAHTCGGYKTFEPRGWNYYQDYRALFSEDFSQLLVSVDGGDQGVEILDLATNERIPVPESSQESFSEVPVERSPAGWSSDGSVFVLAGTNSSSGQILELDPKSGEILNSVDNSSTRVVVKGENSYKTGAQSFKPWALRKTDSGDLFPRLAVVGPSGEVAAGESDLSDHGIVYSKPGELLASESLDDDELMATTGLYEHDTSSRPAGWISETTFLTSGYRLVDTTLLDPVSRRVILLDEQPNLLPDFTDREVEFPLVTPSGRVLIRSAQGGKLELFEADPVNPGSQPTLLRNLEDSSAPVEVASVLGWTGSFCPTGDVCEMGTSEPWVS